ncbi:NAC domain-containing protein 104-like isoform X1 [Musa acuminata AAA Group]|uniref:NAC domain-containing protein 104-like isoform X1 n=1 Tax=Musa acuminata AAA Group TaxID=214697 RepID=UPI0031D38317
MGEGAADLPPGFRFFPSDEELVVHFLYRKTALLPFHPDIIPTLDLHRCDPWNFHGKAFQGGNRCWYFFTSRSEDRASVSGYWNPVGTDEVVISGNKDVGVKTTLKYYIGQPPDGIKTNWLMHEYRLLDATVHGGSSTCSSTRRERGQPVTISSSSSSSPSSSSSALVANTSFFHYTTQEFNKWVICRAQECCSQASAHDDGGGGTELSCLDEVFLSLDDLDEVSLPN